MWKYLGPRRHEEKEGNRMEGHSLTMRLPGSVALLLICAILAFGLTLQIRSVYRIKSGAATGEAARADQLQQDLNNQRQKSQELANEVSQLSGTVSEYRQQAAKTGNVTSALNDQLTQAEILAGMAAVSGPGVVVTMQDSKQTVASGTDQNAYVIHDVDILQALNELRDAGAEALSLNGERILATTEVRCAGSVVSINNNRYAAPFVIRAVGNPDELKNALTMRGGLADSLAQWGIDVEVGTSQSLVIGAYSGTPDFRYAKPTKGGD